MSQPKRYTIRGIIASDGNAYAEETVSPFGIWVEWSDYAALAAENERLAASVSRLEKENALIREANIAAATISKTVSQENEVLRKKVEWLQKADRLVVWNGTEWQVRHVVEQPIKPRE